MTTSPREIYPSPAVQFVTFDMQYPTTLGLQRPEAKEALYERLSDGYPLLQSVNTMEFPFVSADIAGAPTSSPMPGFPTASTSIKMLNRERTGSVTVGATSLQVETSFYVGYEAFAAAIRQALQGLAEVSSVPGVQRIGLRYTDEIRIPGIDRPADWALYVDASLLGPVALADYNAKTTRSVVEFVLGNGRAIRMQYGAMPDGHPPTVNPAGPLRLRTTGPGPYFLMDMDGYWEAPESGVPVLVVDEVLGICDELHVPLHDLFEAAITERLRDEVLRRPTA